MRVNKVKANIRAGRPSFGVGTHWPSPELAEFCGWAGFDWFWVDVEHGSFDLQALANTVRAAELTDMPTFGRFPRTRDLDFVLRYMETGLMGIVTAFTESREDVEFAKRAIKYPPLGERSAGALRPAEWGLNMTYAEYAETMNRETMIMSLVETKEGVENIDDILSSPDLDAVLLGAGDLSLTMGYPGQKNHPEVVKLMKQAEAKILASGKALWRFEPYDGEAAHQAVKEGALMVRASCQGILSQSLREWLNKACGQVVPAKAAH